MNKKGIELSINFLVIIILSIVVLSMGLVFIAKIWMISPSIIEQGFSLIDEEIEEQITAGRRVAVYPSSAKGEDIAWFGLGVRNTVATEPNFIVDVQCTGFYDLEGNSDACDSDDVTLTYDNTITKIENNEYKRFILAVEIDKTAVKGSYAITITVRSGSGAPATVYMDPLLITVTKR